MKWRKFNLEGAKFNTPKDEKNYIEWCRCAVCHQKLQKGELFDLRPITNNPGFNQQAVIVHKKCLDEKTG